jgi:hypothetical protein
VFSNGIFALSGCAALLLVIFNASVTRLIPLYAVGVFISFTLSQAGMVVHWLKEKGQGWLGKALVNGFGAAITAVSFESATTTTSWPGGCGCPLISCSNCRIPPFPVACPPWCWWASCTAAASR